MNMDSLFSLHTGDCRELLRLMSDNSVDSIVTDPPYELGFMGKAWDSTGIAYDVTVWRECLRVLKPGGHLLAFGGSRTYHRLACAVEDAGFEIRDQIQWVYGSGFPKSLDVSKAIDKAAGAERTERIGVKPGHEKFVGRDNVKALREGTMSQEGGFSRPWMYDPERVEAAHHITAPATDAAREWSGWGTALKPAHEPIVMARKPLTGTVADNVQTWGTGAINVDACRVGVDGGTRKGNPPKPAANGVYGNGINGACDIVDIGAGRWPANLIHDGSDEVVRLFPNTGKSTGGRTVKRSGGGNVGSGKTSEASWTNDDPGYGDSGSAARFFYCAKASKRDRDAGLEDRNTHATVKPTDLMRYLCRLVTPPGGVVLDPFAGSGSTGKAAILEGFRFIGIELEADHVAIAAARIAHARRNEE